MQNDQYKLGRTHVTKMSFEEADDHTTYWQDKTPDERLNAACFLINQFYGVTAQTKVDRTITDHRNSRSSKSDIITSYITHTKSNISKSQNQQ